VSQSFLEKEKKSWERKEMLDGVPKSRKENSERCADKVYKKKVKKRKKSGQL